jgi:hypothetical protein
MVWPFTNGRGGSERGSRAASQRGSWVNVKIGAAASGVDHPGVAYIDFAYPLLRVSHAPPEALLLR